MDPRDMTGRSIRAELRHLELYLRHIRAEHSVGAPWPIEADAILRQRDELKRELTERGEEVHA